LHLTIQVLNPCYLNRILLKELSSKIRWRRSRIRTPCMDRCI